MKKTIGKTKEKMLHMMLLAALISGCIVGCGRGSASETAADFYETEAKEESYDMDGGFDTNGMETADSYDYEEGEYDMESAVDAKGDVPLEESKEVPDEASGMDGNAFGLNENTSGQDGNVSGQDGNASEQNAKTSQKIIKRYDYSYETEHFDDAYAYLKQQIQDYNGYISSSEMTSTEYSADYRTLYLTARIPAEQSDAFVSDLGELGTIIRQSESAEDVTLQYSDTESRIASLKTEQQRLNELLAKADKLENIIALEERLTEVRYELESYQSKKNLYDDLISYSTIEITLEEVKYTVEMDDSTFITRIRSGLESSFRNITGGAVALVEWFIIKSPYLIIFVLIILAIVKGIRRSIRKRREKKMKKRNTSY